MEHLIIFLNENLNYMLLAIIVMGGIFITKYTKEFNIKDTYKVLFASVLFSVIFYFIDGCGSKCLSMYLFTYLFATSFYELIVKWLLDKIKKLKEN